MKSVFVKIKGFSDRENFGDYKLYLTAYVKEPDKNVYRLPFIDVDAETMEYKFSKDICYKFAKDTKILFAVYTNKRTSNLQNYIGTATLNFDPFKTYGSVEIQLKSYRSDRQTLRNMRVSIKNKYDVEIGKSLTLKDLVVEENWINEFYGTTIYPYIKRTFYIKLNDSDVVFSELNVLDDEEKIIKLKVSYRDSYYETGYVDVKINPINKQEEKEYLTLSKIEYSYAFFSILRKNNYKPTIPVAIFVSDNFNLKSIDIYIDGEKYDSIKEIDNLIDVNVSSVEPFVEHELKLIFNGVNSNGESITKEHAKNFIVSDVIEADLGLEYNSDDESYTINLSTTSETYDNINNIIWKVTFDSYVFQNILDVEDVDGMMKTDVIFEKMTDKETNSITVKLSQIGKYTIEAYLIDKGGNVKILSKEIVNGTSADDSSFKIGDKINVSILNKTQNTPTMVVYNINSSGEFSRVTTNIMDNVVDNIYTSSFSAEIDNSLYIAKIGKLIKTYNIGSSRNISILYNPSYDENTVIDYELKNDNDETIKKGNMKYAKDGIFYCVTDADKHGIIRIGRHYKNV